MWDSPTLINLTNLTERGRFSSAPIFFDHDPRKTRVSTMRVVCLALAAPVTRLRGGF